MKILAFGASNSTTSINKQLATYAARQIDDAEITIVDLNDFEMPIYSIDREKTDGIPQLAHDFKAAVNKADRIIISFAEHNGGYSVAFKNVMDWMSRIEGDTWEGKPFFLMSTSPGARGGATVLDQASSRFGFMGGRVLASFSLPKFYENFDAEKGIMNLDMKSAFDSQLLKFIAG